MTPEGSPAPTIRTRIPRPPPEMVAAFRQISPTTVCDILARDAVMDPGIRPLWPGVPRVVGPAFTVRCPAGDNLMVHAAIHRAEPGDILVIQGGDADFALSGGNVCAWAQRRGVTAFVADGVVRDRAEVRERAFPLFARGVIPIPGAKDGPGGINGPVRCGGAAVHPGDIVVADEEGIVVVPLGRAAKVLAEAQAQAAADAAENLESWGRKHRERTDAILRQRGCAFLE